MICPACNRWELNTGIWVSPVPGPPGTPPSIVRLSAPLWRPMPPEKESQPADDPTAYTPMSELIDDDRFPTIKAIYKALDANPSIRWRRPTGKSGKPIPNRKEIHTGDWHRFKRQAQAGDSLDQPSELVDAAIDAAGRQEEIRKRKGEAGK